jgi:hypothetical protein
MAKISVIKQALRLCRDAKITAYVWGHRGLGKSSLVSQLCKEDNMGFIDFRASQIEASDLRGLPDRSNGKTVYLPPSDLPTADLSDEEAEAILKREPHRWAEIAPRRKNGILFLDEVNRAQDDVLQAIFQLVLDRRIGQYTLPEGWSVVAAGNFMEGYQVSGFSDPAFLNRFCHITLSAGESTFPEWVEYMSDNFDESVQKLIDFASADLTHLDGKVEGELGFSVQPSRRSWEMVQRVQMACKKRQVEEVVKTEVIAGLVGRELAIGFAKYDCPVKPGDLLKDGVKAHADVLRTLTRVQFIGLMWGLVSHIKGNVDEPRVGNVCLDFAENMLVKNQRDQDLVVSFLRNCVKYSKNMADTNSECMVSAAITNIQFAKALAQANKKSGKSFISLLNSRPELQKLIQDTAWGA